MLLPQEGSPKTWLPSVLTELGVSSEHAEEAVTHLTSALFKPTNAKLRVALSDSGKWARLLKKLAEHVVSLGGGDAEELAVELDEAMSAKLGAALSSSQTSPPPQSTPPPPPPTSKADTKPTPGDAPNAATPAAAPLPASQPDARTADLAKVRKLALKYAAEKAGERWSVKIVDVDAGERAGQDYKADRCARGTGPTLEDKAALKEATKLGLTAKSEESATLADALADAVTGAPVKPWKPQPYGGKQLVGLLNKLRVDVAFRCPCNPNKTHKIGSLATHRTGDKCRAALAEQSSLQSGMQEAAVKMMDATEQATKARLDELPVLNIPGNAASVVQKASEAATAEAKPTAAVKAERKPAQKPLSGAAKKKLREAKAAARQRALDDYLFERRMCEAAEAEAVVAAVELEVWARAVDAIAARRLHRRSAAQACLERMETEAVAKRRRTQAVLRRLDRLQDRREESMTLDEMLAAAMLDEMLAVPDAAVAGESSWSAVLQVDDTPMAEGEDIVCVGERSWAERDADCRVSAIDLDGC